MKLNQLFCTLVFVMGANIAATAQTQTQQWSVGAQGYSVSATLYNGLLTISGIGEMKDFTASNAPYQSYKSQITRVRIEGGITRIGKNAFAGCANLSIVRVPYSPPNNLYIIGDSAFYNCTKLNLFVCAAQAPPVLGVGVFDGIAMNKSSGVSPQLLVFQGLMLSYKSSGWNRFGDTNIKEAGCDECM